MKIISKDWFPYCAPFALFMMILTLENIIDPQKVGPVYVIYGLKTIIIGSLIITIWRRFPQFKIVSFWGSFSIGAIVFVVWVLLDPYLPWVDGFLNFTWAKEGGLREGGFNPWEFTENFHIAFLIISLRIIGAVLVVPVVEELFWRGWMQRWLVNENFSSVRIGHFTPASFSVVTIMFALVHQQLFVALIAGVIFGWWVVKTNSIWDVVLSHSIANLLLAIFVLLFKRWYFW